MSIKFSDEDRDTHMRDFLGASFRVSLKSLIEDEAKLVKRINEYSLLIAENEQEIKERQESIENVREMLLIASVKLSKKQGAITRFMNTKVPPTEGSNET